MSLFDLVAAHNGKAFAAIVHPQAPKPGTDFLRRDYAFLFQRFFYYLEDRGANETGILVFDEYERTSCVKLIDRMTRYFRDTNTGRIRSQRILPEPFFVHSDLTTLVRIADLVAYSLNWAFRVKGMTHEARVELAPYADKVNSIQYRGKRLGVDGKEWPVFGLFYLDDLRPTIEKVPSGKRKGLASVLARITRTK